jgi:hypothetical protein
MLIAGSLAFLAWLYARGRDPEILDNVPIPVQVALGPAQAEHYDLEVNGPGIVPVSFQGPPSRMRELRSLIQRGELQIDMTVVVPEEHRNENRYLDAIRVDSSDIHAPPGITPIVLEGRNRIPITLRRIVQRRLPVRLDPGPDERVRRISIEPDTVLVRGPKVILDRIRSVPTQPCLAPSNGEPGPDEEVLTLNQVALARELEGRPISCVPDCVAIRVTFRPQEEVRRVGPIPVRFLCAAEPWFKARFLEPERSSVVLELLGPANEDPVGVSAFVDLASSPFKPGRYSQEFLRFDLPPGFRLRGKPPYAPAFEIAPSESERFDDGNRKRAR